MQFTKIEGGGEKFDIHTFILIFFVSYKMTIDSLTIEMRAAALRNPRSQATARVIVPSIFMKSQMVCYHRIIYFVFPYS